MKHLCILSCVLISTLVALAVGYFYKNYSPPKIPQPTAISTPRPTPFTVYHIENLEIPESTEEIKIKEVIADTEDYESYIFTHEFDPTTQNGVIKKVTGQINIPKNGDKFPVVLMIRGYVDQSIYETGVGTKNAAAYFSKNGLITIAPDYLGYGGSDKEAADIFETRFQTYTTTLSILKAIESMDKFDGKNIFIWAHSNGGQIALTALAATKENIPATLWAPVTKPFPYSILYYTDQSADGGKYIRKELAKFEEAYDVNLFSFTNYLDKIAAPLQFQQGGADDAIPASWTNSIVAKLRNLGREVTYYFYPSADHNLRPDWDTAVSRDVDFFRKFIEN